jgi:hypothetical protein
MPSVLYLGFLVCLSGEKHTPFPFEETLEIAVDIIVLQSFVKLGCRAYRHAA